MSKFLSQALVDVTFNAWWTTYGRRPDTVQRALHKTIDQINGEAVRRPNGPFPPSYQPPPWRKKTKADKVTRADSKGRMKQLRRLAKQYAPVGRAVAQKELSTLGAHTNGSTARKRNGCNVKDDAAC